MDGLRRMSKTALNVALIVLGLKLFAAFVLSGSTALAADALITALYLLPVTFGLYAIAYEGHYTMALERFIESTLIAPKNTDLPDDSIEWVSTLFVGLLLFMISIFLVEAVFFSWQHMISFESAALGGLVSLFATVLLVGLAIYLVSVSKQTHTPSISALGNLIVVNVWQSFILLFGMVLVIVSEAVWLDNVVALIASQMIMGMASVLLMRTLPRKIAC